MMNDRRWLKAIEQTFVVRFPKQHLATFGATNIKYYVVTEPAFQEEVPETYEGVVRTGKVVAERPAIVTPSYMSNLDGFSSDAYEFFHDLMRTEGPNSPGIMYRYSNKPENSEVVGGVPTDIAHRISKDLNDRKEELSVVMVGVDELWDVALLKFIYEFTASSVAGNVQELNARGLLSPEENFGGAPSAAVQQIDRLFREVERGNRGGIDLLKQEIDRWGLFEFYQDRFLNLFRQ